MPRVEWVKVGTDVVIGGGAGVVDQLVSDYDKRRAEELQVDRLAMLKQFGTYYNFGVPILSILGVAFGVLKGDMATRLVSVGSVLAGRKGTEQVKGRGGTVGYRGWRRQDKPPQTQGSFLEF